MRPQRKLTAGVAIGVLMILPAGIPGLLMAHGWEALAK
jgi:hypothetical protein